MPASPLRKVSVESDVYIERCRLWGLMGLIMAEHQDYEKAWLEMFSLLKAAVPEYVKLMSTPVLPEVIRRRYGGKDAR